MMAISKKVYKVCFAVFIQNGYLFPDMNMQDYLILRYIQLLRTGQYMDIQKCGLQLKRRRKIYKCTI